LDPLFQADEKLFYRVDPTYEHTNKDLTSEQRVLLAVRNTMRVPRTSVNREKYCDPLDVLKPSFDDHAVVQFTVEDSTLSIVGGAKAKGAAPSVFDFAPAHDPLDKDDPAGENYAHTELRVAKAEAQNIDEVPGFVRRQYRDAIADKASVIHVPPGGLSPLTE
jgi:hypothetical protein